MPKKNKTKQKTLTRRMVRTPFFSINSISYPLFSPATLLLETLELVTTSTFPDQRLAKH